MFKLFEINKYQFPMKSQKFLFALSIMALSSTAAHAATDDNKEHAKKEKCYGIVKAGKNDCSAADGSHSCAGYAKADSSGKEWVLLPEGTCDRIQGGTVKPVFDKKS